MAPAAARFARIGNDRARSLAGRTGRLHAEDAGRLHDLTALDGVHARHEAEAFVVRFGDEDGEPLALEREGQEVLVPTGHEALQVGDLLALAGTHEAVEAARALLAPPPAASLQEHGAAGAP